MKLVVLDGYTLNAGDLSWEALGALGELRVYDRTSYTDTAEIIKRIGDATAVFTNKTPITAEVLAACPTLRYIGIFATGYNVVDLMAAQERDITVTNIPNYSTEAVAQFTFALLLEIASQVGAHNTSVQAGDWVHSQDFSYCKQPLMELSGKTMGLIGYGAIAHRVADIAHAFGMRVLYFNHRPKAPQAPWIEQVSLSQLLGHSDVVSLHVPLFPNTQGMIGSEALQQMKKGAILLNTSRGGLLDEEAVAEALNHHHLAALGADVISVEPMQEENPLLHAPNCYLTPHIAWAAVETRQRLMDIAVENLRQYLNGTPQNVVRSSN